MKTAFLSSLLLLLVGVASAASSNCKALCKDSRQSILNDITSCKPALKQNNSKNFHLCVEGRKKSYDQACVSVCSNAELTVSSFDGCQPVAKSYGSQALSWCRRGYDSILHTLGPLLGELESSELLLEVEEEVGELVAESPSDQTEVVQEQEQKSSEPVMEHEQPIKVVESEDEEETPVEEPVKTFEAKQEPMKNVDSVVDSALQMDDDQSVYANAGDAEQIVHTSYEIEDAAANLHEHYSDSTSNVDEQQDTEFEL